MSRPASGPSAQAGLIVTEAAVHAAVSSVDDPEYPGISIVDLGLLESLSIDPDPGPGADGGAESDAESEGRCAVTVGLVPTFSGCPALAVIAEDVSAAVSALPGVASVAVEWLATPAWTVERVSHDARAALAQSFTVAVQIGGGPGEAAGVAGGSMGARCPRCGGSTEEQSMFGPSRCRSVHRCTVCSETVEVLRG